MEDKKIILEEISRMRYILEYNLGKTSVENLKVITEWKAFRDLLMTRDGVTAVRGEIESVLKTGNLEIKAVKDLAGGTEILTRASDILKAIKDGRLTEQSLLELKGAMFQTTTNPGVIEAIAKDLVNSKEWERSYAHLSNQEILSKLRRGKLKVNPNSDQARAILNAHEAKLAEELRAAEELRNAENLRQRDPYRESPYRSEKEWKDYSTLRTEEERAREFYRRYGGTIESEARTNPKGLFEKIKDAGLFLKKKGGKWVLTKAVKWLIFGGLAYAVWKNWSTIVGAIVGCGDGEIEDPNTGECVKSGTSADDGDDNNENIIRDEQGNVYNPCTGVYKINCVTKDGINELGTDYISKAQECLGLSPTGMFNKELENKLSGKINKRSFTKDDIRFICMGGGTLARL
jgi:hypothetical protein